MRILIFCQDTVPNFSFKVIKSYSQGQGFRVLVIIFVEFSIENYKFLKFIVVG